MKGIKLTRKLIIQVILSIALFCLVFWLMENLPDLIRGFSK